MIGRAEESRTLMDCFASNRAEFVAIYGRRRVGKTYLVKTLLEESFVFYATGLKDGEKAEQLRNFNDEIANFGGDPALPASDWREAFDNLRKLLAARGGSEKKVIFLDEISWMAKPKTTFLSALDHFWNRWMSSRKDVLLILCGSATAWILENIVNDTGGLHNRLTRQIALAPFTLRECEEYYCEKGMTVPRYQIAEAYMVFGGIPYYLDYMRPELSLYQNIDRLYFQAKAPLGNEYDNLFRSLFKNAGNHEAVIRALSEKARGVTRADIEQATGQYGGGLTKVLEELIACDFVRKYRAFGKKERDRLYQLVDPFTFFHLRFHDRKETYSENFWLQFSASPGHAAWSGYAFEQVCLLHVPQIKRKLGISGVLTEVYSWRSKEAIPGAQIDLVLDRADRVVNLCEIKFSSGEYRLDKAGIEKLRNRRSAFEYETKTRKATQLTMISTYGLVRNEYGAEILSQVVLEDLFAG